jgi:UDP-N-acetyl-D-glucosamine dehydrogenase
MPEHLVEKLALVLNDHGKCISGSKILLLGVAYKKDVSDIRESPALDVLQLLLDRKADVHYYDPNIPEFKWENKIFQSQKGLNSISNYDVVVIITDHSSVDYAMAAKGAKLILDSRNATKGIESKNIFRL